MERKIEVYCVEIKVRVRCLPAFTVLSPECEEGHGTETELGQLHGSEENVRQEKICKDLSSIP